MSHPACQWSKWSLWNLSASLRQCRVQQTADTKVTRSHRVVSVQHEFWTLFPWGSIKGHRFKLEHLEVIDPQSGWQESRGHSAFRWRRGGWITPTWVLALFVAQVPLVLSPPSCYTVIKHESKVIYMVSELCFFVLLNLGSHLQINNKTNDRSLISFNVALPLLLYTRGVKIQTREVKDFPSAHTGHSCTPSLFMSHQQHLTSTSLWSDTLMQSEVSAEQQAQRWWKHPLSVRVAFCAHILRIRFSIWNSQRQGGG